MSSYRRYAKWRDSKVDVYTLLSLNKLIYNVLNKKYWDYEYAFRDSKVFFECRSESRVVMKDYFRKGYTKFYNFREKIQSQ